MEEFKGTKGKWEINDDYIQSANSKQMIADCFPTTDEDRANALLIYKAPEMLNALIRLLQLTKEMEKRIIDIEKLSYADPKFLAEINQLIKEATELK